MVGGAVRHLILKVNENPSDIDFEYRGDKKTLIEILLKHEFIVEELAYEIIRGKKNNLIYEFAPPRIENFVPENFSHKNFTVKITSELNYGESFKRRDLTINAIGYDPLTCEVIDPFGGVKDLLDGVLRAVDNETFAKDYLRFFRLVKFKLRFSYAIHESVPFSDFNFSHINWSLVWKEARGFDLGFFLSTCKKYLVKTIPMDEMSKLLFLNEKIDFLKIHQLSDLPKVLKDSGVSKEVLITLQNSLEVKIKTINGLYFNSESK